MTDLLMSGLSALADPSLLLLIVITTLAGTIIGVLPGLSGTTGAALALPFTLTMDPVSAVVVLATIYGSSTFAGCITAILIIRPAPRPRPRPAWTATHWPKG